MIELRIETEVLAPCERCFDLARSVDLHVASSHLIAGKAVAHRLSGLSEPGDMTTWSARFFGVRFRLTTAITHFDRPHSFSDVLCAGLFRHFAHVYTFEARGDNRTVMTDNFSFESPFGLLGAAFDALILRRRMLLVASSRALCIKRVAESDAWRNYNQ